MSAILFVLVSLVGNVHATAFDDGTNSVDNAAPFYSYEKECDSLDVLKQAIISSGVNPLIPGGSKIFTCLHIHDLNVLEKQICGKLSPENMPLFTCYVNNAETSGVCIVADRTSAVKKRDPQVDGADSAYQYLPRFKEIYSFGAQPVKLGKTKTQNFLGAIPQSWIMDETGCSTVQYSANNVATSKQQCLYLVADHMKQTCQPINDSDLQLYHDCYEGFRRMECGRFFVAQQPVI